jgi:hypothetical protein
MSGSQFGRIERGELRGVSVEQWCRAAAAVGLRLHVRAYPSGDALRDVPQARLLARFRGRLHSGVQLRTEVPLHGRTDSRAWDGVIDFDGERDAVEAETRIRDGQAMWRRVALKRRDDSTISHVFLLVADTPANRRAIGEIRELLRPDLPLDSRRVLSALAKGRCPGRVGSCSCNSRDPRGGSTVVAIDASSARRVKRRRKDPERGSTSDPGAVHPRLTRRAGRSRGRPPREGAGSAETPGPSRRARTR